MKIKQMRIFQPSADMTIMAVVPNRKSYLITYNASVVEYSFKHGQKSASELFNIHTSMISSYGNISFTPAKVHSIYPWSDFAIIKVIKGLGLSGCNMNPLQMRMAGPRMWCGCTTMPRVLPIFQVRVYPHPPSKLSPEEAAKRRYTY